MESIDCQYHVLLFFFQFQSVSLLGKVNDTFTDKNPEVDTAIRTLCKVLGIASHPKADVMLE